MSGVGAQGQAPHEARRWGAVGKGGGGGGDGRLSARRRGLRGPAWRRELEAVVGCEAVLGHPAQLATYEKDSFLARRRPEAVVLPTSAEQVAAVVRVAARYGLPVTARGAGTGLSGGATPVLGGLVVSFARMNRILAVDAPNLRATVQPGVVNLELTRAAAAHGLYYAPDPSSQAASTLGGNVAENAGGPHCLAYGVTTNHVLGLQVVLADGTVVRLGGGSHGGHDRPGYDLCGLLTGSEGTLGFVTEITLRLMPVPEAVRTILALFDSVADAGRAASAIIAAGVIPAALEFLDGTGIGALRRAGFTDYPAGVEALLLVELEGLTERIEGQAGEVERVCLACGATEVRAARSAAERARLWAGRKGALTAVAQLGPHYYVQDGVVPRSRLVEALGAVQEIARRYQLTVANIFHAGDGNLHPLILFDARVPGMVAKVVAAGEEMLRACVDLGGTLSGEHGVGIEKQAYLPWVFAPADLAAMERLRRAFDPAGGLNPGKMLPAGQWEEGPRI